MGNVPRRQPVAQYRIEQNALLARILGDIGT
jgi:hypothetical protein